MKLKISLVFIVLYILSLVFTAPASLLTRFIPNNAGVKIAEVSGTVWNGQLSQVDYRGQFQLQKVTWDFDWLALLSFKLKADVTFNNRLKALSGDGATIYDLSGLSVANVDIELQATELTPYLQLPIPVTPLGTLNLMIESGSLGKPYCEVLDGYLVWHDAKVESAMGSIDFASPNIDLSCSNGELVALLKQNSDQLTTNANILLSEGGRYQLEGNIIGHDKLDPTILGALPLIGVQNQSGEVMLNFKGRL